VPGRVAEAFRVEYARMVAAAVRIVRDLDIAEEIAQETFARALDHWRRRRRADAHADALAYETVLGALDETTDVTDADEIPDDRLRLIFTCCHPGLPADSRVALTLRLVGGLSTPEIARAFLVPEPTIAQRLVRAKRTIRERALPWDVPEGAELAERLPAVLAVVYLIFNEGYAAHAGDTLVRHELCGEAIRLGRMLAELMPGEPEVLGLLALMELQGSRAASRVDAEGNLVLLADQDRAGWDRAAIARGLEGLERAGSLDRAGPYGLQAAIAACHARGVLGGDRLDADRAPLRRPRGGDAVARRRAQPRGGDRDGGGRGGGARGTRRDRRQRAPCLSPATRRARRLSSPAGSRGRGGRRVSPRARPHRQRPRALVPQRPAGGV
jgi:predicted RNA polymerase sigma factor